MTVLCTPNLKTLLMHTLSYYLAELFLISYYCWGISFLNTLLRYSQSWTLLTYTLCYYMAELYPILVHCRTMVYLNTLLSVFTNVVGSQSESSITSPESPESCRLEWRFLWSLVGIAQPCNSTRYTSAMLKIGNISAVY